MLKSSTYPYYTSTYKDLYLLNTPHSFGFNGKENDNEVKGAGNSIDYGARISDPRLGRWFSPDPEAHMYMNYSPYSFALLNPLIISDVDGRKVIVETVKYRVVNGQKVQLSKISFRKAEIIERNVTVHNAKIIDLTRTMSGSDLSDYAKIIEGGITKTWTSKGSKNADEEGYVTNDKGQKVLVTTTFANPISVANSSDDIKNGDHVFAIVNDEDSRLKISKGQYAAGVAPKGGAIMYLAKGANENDPMLESHETGHWGRLGDLEDPAFANTHLMYHNSSPAGTATTPASQEFSDFFQGGSSYGAVKNGENKNIDLTPSEKK